MASYYKIPKDKLDDILFDSLVEEKEEAKSNKEYSVFSQRDPRWKNIKLGFGSTTIGSHGCFLTCLSMIVGKRPDEVNEILKKAGAYSRDLMISYKAAEALGLEYNGKETNISKMPQYSPSIKEVTMGKSSQHFVLRIIDKEKKAIIDPWTGRREYINFYPFRSYRLFKKKR
jgi:hypothetical protein